MRILCVALCFGLFACAKSESNKSERAPTKPKLVVKAESKPAATDTGIKSPAPLAGSELIGKSAPAWQFVEWANSKPITLAQLKGRVVLVRFWTNGCPFCVKSLPAMQQLADEFRGKPVTIIGAYHSKPFKSERPWKQAVDTANKWGVKFPLAYDRQWKTVFGWWLKGHKRKATSASFVIDAEGKFAHVHAGPVFYPSEKAYDKQENEDFIQIRRAIKSALAKAKS